MADSKRGFAAMSKAKQREIASKGGKASRGGRNSASKMGGAAGSTLAASRGGRTS